MAEEILKMINITKRFAGITALDHVNFSCNKGEVHILAGEKPMKGIFFFMEKRLRLKIQSIHKKWGSLWFFRN
ncbi:MAG: hypothetical protein Q4C84_15865 [Bacillota bacterium]|nr:hypothetical protein [Bacillota bacterium]